MYWKIKNSESDIWTLEKGANNTENSFIESVTVLIEVLAFSLYVGNDWSHESIGINTTEAARKEDKRQE